MGKFRKKRLEQEATQDVFDKETGVSPVNAQLDLLSVSTMSVKQTQTLCGLPSPWKHGRGRKKHWVMKKFGFGKKEKSENDDGDSSRSGLFGRKKSTPSRNENPYAQQPAEDPYARVTPYQQARANPAAGPRGPLNGLPSGPSPSNQYNTPPPSYSATAQEKNGYQPQRYGATGGYGSSRYDGGPLTYGPIPTTASPAPSYGTGKTSARGPGGYGGLGSAEDGNIKAELLAGATGKYVDQGPVAPLQGPGTTGSGLAATDHYPGGPASTGGYGEERELTAEELEEREVQDIRNEAKQIKRDDISSLQRTNQMAWNSLETARGINERLAQQEDMLFNTEKNLDTARIHAKIADHKTQELESLNGSMFSVSNPFTKTKRKQRELDAAVRSYEQDTRTSGQTRAAEYQVQQGRMQQAMGYNHAPSQPLGLRRPTQRDKRYMLDDDDQEDEKLEDEIEAELDMASRLVGAMHTQAQGIGQTLGRQNAQIDRLAIKSADVDTDLVKTRHVMSRIH